MEGLRQALVRQLTHRFGNLPDALLAALQGVTDPERLEQLLDAVIDASDIVPSALEHSFPELSSIVSRVESKF